MARTGWRRREKFLKLFEGGCPCGATRRGTLVIDSHETFCPDCGSPLFYDYAGGRNITLTLGSLAAPLVFPPVEHNGAENRLP
ncbi:aldehyde-activating protein [Gluconobacter wancherniae NBRC 103581]|uniref:CENP-V/GFA domain-containing protein n=1 Tax=Gluconobacter wancherniae NBRC 103581 TaxID=656744 RepID=A0A511AZF7_9PROT|nr:aldehyde-activating protein [Gluconobacter wancherniae NBRC 103581]GBR66633.1 hypothetical protein AA103581_2459 [Gluconobacter wancherniae NBRC 103581]GEK93584.1 hypothetical protein GWA01_13540 [Gluconobacter wancherniae NBRC 103581]